MCTLKWCSASDCAEKSQRVMATVRTTLHNIFHVFINNKPCTWRFPSTYTHICTYISKSKGMDHNTTMTRVMCGRDALYTLLFKNFGWAWRLVHRQRVLHVNIFVYVYIYIYVAAFLLYNLSWLLCMPFLLMSMCSTTWPYMCWHTYTHKCTNNYSATLVAYTRIDRVFIYCI